ncbi:hypothetical protein ACFVFS_18835 [Kitasatospora sp. NPDC057692]|uniref:hypothetical protein n=1 Tax=Kitasatospora sp. NPDC057692 TaxID=3346215 RepID=UPI0036743883
MAVTTLAVVVLFTLTLGAPGARTTATAAPAKVRSRAFLNTRCPPGFLNLCGGERRTRRLPAADSGIAEGVGPQVTAGFVEFGAMVRIDVPGEADCYRNDGTLEYVLRGFIS